MAPIIVSSASAPEVHGHRGCRGLRPENTLPAFLHALALGADALELDVAVSADQQVLVAHEPWFAAKLGPGPDGQPIRPGPAERALRFYALPYAHIRACPVGEWPLPGFPEQQPVLTSRPLLSEVFQAAETSAAALGRTPVAYSVEVKSDPAGDDLFHPRPARFVELVLAELRAAGVLARTNLLSFDPRILQEARRACPALRLCLLVENSTPPAQLLHELGFVPDTLGPAFGQLSEARVRELAARFPGLRLVPWTVNELPDLRRVLSWGVAGITTDYPDRLLRLLGRL